MRSRRPSANPPTAHPWAPLWLARLLSVAGGALVLLFLRVQPASAAVAAGSDDKLGQTPAALAWIHVKDSRGIPLWNYEMSLDRGGVTHPDRFFWSSVTDICWGAYRSVCALAIWFLDWVLSFGWVKVIASPLIEVGDALQQLVDQLGLVPTFLTASAFMAGFWMLKGRMSTAVWEVVMACVIAALASGVFAHPVNLVAGENGYVVKANQTGQELAAGLATGDAEGKSPDQLRASQTGQLVDTFIRQPTEMTNFGKVIDGTKCEKSYDQVVKSGPYGNDDDIRNKMDDCDSALGDYASNPSASMAIGSVVFFPASFVILLMAVVLGGSVIAAGVWAIFQSLKAVITFVTGLLPGGGRGSLMLTVSETLISLVIIVFTSVFLSAFLLVIQALFAGSSGSSVPRTFVIVDVVIAVALWVYLRQRANLKAASARMAQWMAQRPGGAPPSRMPDRQPGMGLGTAMSGVQTATSLARLRSQRRIEDQEPPLPSYVDNRQQAVVFANMGGFGRPGPRVVPNDPGHNPGGPSSPRQLGAGGTEGGPTPAGDPAGGAGPARAGLARVANKKKVAGTLARAGTHAALAYATGGASTLSSGAARTSSAAQNVRRTAVASRMAAAAGKTASTSSGASSTGNSSSTVSSTASGPGARPSPNPSPNPSPGPGSGTRARPAPPPRTPGGRAVATPTPAYTPGPSSAASSATVPGEVVPPAAKSQPRRGSRENLDRAARLRERLTARHRTTGTTPPRGGRG